MTERLTGWVGESSRFISILFCLPASPSVLVKRDLLAQKGKGGISNWPTNANKDILYGSSEGRQASHRLSMLIPFTPIPLVRESLYLSYFRLSLHFCLVSNRLLSANSLNAAYPTKMTFYASSRSTFPTRSQFYNQLVVGWFPFRFHFKSVHTGTGFKRSPETTHSNAPQPGRGRLSL